MEDRFRRYRNGEILIAIWAENGSLYGRIEKLIDPDPHDPDPRCNRCDGEMKGRPRGFAYSLGLRQDGEQWSGGKILDPENGKIYKGSMAFRRTSGGCAGSPGCTSSP